MSEKESKGEMEEQETPLQEKKVANGKAHEDEEKAEERDTWSGKLDFIMSALSFAVGMGNLWRFPYLCYRNGGGAFLIPYVIMVAFAGIPLMFLEFAFGQYGRLGIVSIWKVCPLLKGIGWGMFLVSFITAIYYNMLNAYCIYYIAASFQALLPWQNCGNWWNTDDCTSLKERSAVKQAEESCGLFDGMWNNATLTCCFTRDLEVNSTCFDPKQISGDTFYTFLNISKDSLNTTTKISPSDEYFHHHMLRMSDGITDLGEVRWDLALCLLFCWLIVFICLFKGIKTSGKATYVTAMFPYFVLVILFIRGMTLDGAADGILFYLTPKWELLARPKVWVDATIQVMFSMAPCWGCLLTLASYNDFHNNHLRDAFVVAIGDTLTAFFGGIVIFSFLGYMAKELSVDVSEVATQGAGLAFIVYPEAVTTLPISQLWSVLFMLMLINVGLGTQFAMATTIQTTIVDEFPYFKKKWRPTMVLAAASGICFILALPCCTRGGMYVLQLMDTYSATYALLVFGVLMCVALVWIYGWDRWSDDISKMLGSKPSRFWMVCWRFITPLLLVAILIFTFADFKRTKYADYTFPVWADVIGWMIPCAQIGVVPALAIWQIARADKQLSFKERIAMLLRPTPDWDANAKKAMSAYQDAAMEPLQDLNVNNLDSKDQAIA